MLTIAFVGGFAMRLTEHVLAKLDVECQVIANDEIGIIPMLGDVDCLPA